MGTSERAGSDPRGHPRRARLTRERAQKSRLEKLAGVRASLFAIGGIRYSERRIGGVVSGSAVLADGLNRAESVVQRTDRGLAWSGPRTVTTRMIRTRMSQASRTS